MKEERERRKSSMALLRAGKKMAFVRLLEWFVGEGNVVDYFNK